MKPGCSVLLALCAHPTNVLICGNGRGMGSKGSKKMGSSLVVPFAQTDRKAINTSAPAAVFTLSIHSRVLLGEWC